jgi:hypothetical protein
MSLGGQESEARLHLSHIVRLARGLHRTLVLLNVGDSKIGACYKWNLSTYYNVSSLATEWDEEDWFVNLEAFISWIDPRGGKETANSQLVSVAQTLLVGIVFSHSDSNVLV